MSEEHLACFVTHGLEWFAAELWRRYATDYLFHKLGQRKARRDLHVPDKNNLLQYLNRQCGDFTGHYLPKWFGTLNAAYRLADFLRDAGVWPEATRDSWHGICQEIFQENYQPINRFTIHVLGFCLRKIPTFLKVGKLNR